MSEKGLGVYLKRVSFQWESKIIQLLEENTEKYFHDLVIDNNFLNSIQKALTIRERIDKLDLIKLKNFVQQKKQKFKPPRRSYLQLHTYLQRTCIQDVERTLERNKEKKDN